MIQFIFESFVHSRQLLSELKTFRTIVSVFLSFVVLLSSTGFSFSMHYCVGRMESISLLPQARPCKMADDKAVCTRDHHAPECEHETANIEDPGCCSDHSIQVSGQDHPAQIASFPAPHVQMALVLNAVATLLIDVPHTDTHSFQAYSPPLTNRDITILVQSFLI